MTKPKRGYAICYRNKGESKWTLLYFQESAADLTYKLIEKAREIAKGCFDREVTATLVIQYSKPPMFLPQRGRCLETDQIIDIRIKANV